MKHSDLKLQEIAKIVAAHFDLSVAKLQKPNRRNSDARFIFIYLADLLTTKRIGEIGEYVNRSERTAIKAIKRLKNNIRWNGDLKADLKLLEAQIMGVDDE